MEQNVLVVVGSDIIGIEAMSESLYWKTYVIELDHYPTARRIVSMTIRETGKQPVVYSDSAATSIVEGSTYLNDLLVSKLKDEGSHVHLIETQSNYIATLLAKSRIEVSNA